MTAGNYASVHANFAVEHPDIWTPRSTHSVTSLTPNILRPKSDDAVGSSSETTMSDLAPVPLWKAREILLSAIGTEESFNSTEGSASPDETSEVDGEGAILHRRFEVWYNGGHRRRMGHMTSVHDTLTFVKRADELP